MSLYINVFSLCQLNKNKPSYSVRFFYYYFKFCTVGRSHIVILLPVDSGVGPKIADKHTIYKILYIILIEIYIFIANCIYSKCQYQRFKI